MAAEAADKVLTRSEATDLATPYALDLKAFFVVLEEAVNKTVSAGVRAGLGPDQIIREVDNMLDGAQGSGIE